MRALAFLLLFVVSSAFAAPTPEDKLSRVFESI
jgi:hypothetical protein